MPNPRAQKPLSYEQIIKDAKSLGVPAQALLDALAGGVKGSVSATVGAPADIYNLINQASFRGQLPTAPYGSEDISKMLPDVVPTEDKSRKHSADYGEFAGSFIPTPMAGQALKGAVKLGAKGARALGEEAGRRAVMGESFTPFVNTAIPQTNVIKPKGGNWFTGEVEKGLKGLRDERGIHPEDMKQLEKDLAEISALPNAAKKHNYVIRQMKDEIENARIPNALNNWVDKNLTNYVKNQMGTPEDPVRKLAEQGILHSPMEEGRYRVPQSIKFQRSNADFPQEGMGQSELAKSWEHMSDASIDPYQMRGLLNVKDASNRVPLVDQIFEQNPWLSKLNPADVVYGTKEGFNRLGFDHILDVLKEDVASGRLRPESLKNVSMEQAVRRAYEYDQELAKKMEDAKAKRLEGMTVHKEYPEGYKWVQLDKPGQFAAESDSMGHSVRGYEPPQGHPDWIPESGDSGSEYYGHGGWEAIKNKEAKVYSLVDSKGNPHTTVEVKANQNPYPVSGEAFAMLPQSTKAQYGQYVREWRQRNPHIEDLTDEHTTQALKEAGVPPQPDSITQIKGKGNGKIVDSYIPYVQDFVKSGNWGDVGDIKNTGLYKLDKDFLGQVSAYMPEAVDIQHLKRPQREEAILKAMDAGDLKSGYITRNEYESAIRKHGLPTYGEVTDDLLNQLQAPVQPVEGMKRGGAVHISDNPDAMYMELMDRKFAGGGAIAKLTRALAKKPEEIKAIAERMAPQVIGEEFIRGKQGTQSIAGKTQKQFAREKELEHDIRPTKELPEVKPVDLAEHKGKVMIGIAGDPSIAHHEVHAVAGSPLSSPSPQHGGPFYGRGNEPFWASGLGAANRVQNLAREASGQYGNADVLGNYMMMPEGLNYAQHFADANLSAINPSKMTKAQIEGFNDLLRKGSNKSGPRENFPGIEDQGSAYLWMSQDPELRKYFNALMQQPTVTEKFGLPSGKDVAHAITEPDLRNVETGVTGKSLGLLRPEVTNLERSMHPTYSHDIPGEFLGSTSHPIPYELSFPDMMQAIRNNPNQAPQEFGSLKMVGPRQIIDQQLIDEIGEYQRRMKELTGKKKGGAIKKAKGGEISEDDIQMEVRPL